MTNKELEALKEQIKAEVMQELQQKPGPKPPKPWDEIKKMISERVNVEPYKYYQITSAISTLIRYSLSIRKVGDMTFDDLPKAKEIADTILNLTKCEQAQDIT